MFTVIQDEFVGSAVLISSLNRLEMHSLPAVLSSSLNDLEMMKNCRGNNPSNSMGLHRNLKQGGKAQSFRLYNATSISLSLSLYV